MNWENMVARRTLTPQLGQSNTRSFFASSSSARRNIPWSGIRTPPGLLSLPVAGCSTSSPQPVILKVRGECLSVSRPVALSQSPAVFRKVSHADCCAICCILSRTRACASGSEGRCWGCFALPPFRVAGFPAVPVASACVKSGPRIMSASCMIARDSCPWKRRP